ncbi:DEAD/DEAH box helicase family protein [Mesorhizobium sp. RIZ17]|uniref:DEAD/DEAH box helicase family protein n=1 Tax=Mesorhizobium sp. RIZ17 TaxID=3132743 RepID=UPI003DA94CEC
MVDFSKLSRPKGLAAPTDPIEIFKKTPNLGDAPNDLWKGQAEALTQWHSHREASDNVIILNTGAGKSIVGVLIAQSLVNELIGPVVYVCSTIDLVRQTERECNRVGIKYTARVESSFSNDLFETGKAFCITTYASLFAAINAFKNERSPAAVIFDDAHVAERLIRDAFTINVSKLDHPSLYADIVNIVRPEFETLGKEAHLGFILEDVGQTTVTLCPPATAYRHANELIEAFKKYEYKKHRDLFFPVVQLYERIGMCAILVSSQSVEITPPFIPTSKFEFFGSKTRRVYLSATLDYETDFVRGFGVRNTHRIEPDNDAGNGERLILLGSELAKPDGQLDLVAKLASTKKVLVSVPSYPRAKKWAGLAVPPQPKDFTDQLNQFRLAKKGVFCLVSRVDGIDLPQDTCRVMVVDGAPTGSSLLERYQFASLGMTNLFSTKFASRLTQLFGRINRGRSDYGAFALYGNDITSWIKNDRNIALLPELLRKQVILGQSMQKDLGPLDYDGTMEIIQSVLGRDKGWLEFYRDTVDGLEVSNVVIERVKAREAQLAIGAEAECRFMSKLWEGDIDGARKPILDVLNDIAVADAKLAGWYSLWLGMTYEISGDDDTSGVHYRRARSRLSAWVNLPFKKSFQQGVFSTDAKTAPHERLLFVNNQGPQALSAYIARIRTQVASVLNADHSSNQHEEAVRYVGELLGFDATRPDNELGVGPDVVWFDDEQKFLIPFELKTKKAEPAEYSKDEVGQSLNHLQWVAENFKGYRCDGLFVLGPDGTCKANANPSDDLYLLTVKRFRDSLGQFLGRLEDVRGRTALERWTLINEMGQLPEWQLNGWFNLLRDRRLRDIRA